MEGRGVFCVENPICVTRYSLHSKYFFFLCIKLFLSDNSWVKKLFELHDFICGRGCTACWLDDCYCKRYEYQCDGVRHSISNNRTKLLMIWIMKNSSRLDWLSLGWKKTYLQERWVWLLDRMRATSIESRISRRQSFFYICDYLNISAKEFFDQDVSEPVGNKRLVTLIEKLDGEQMEIVSSVVKGLLRVKK